MFKRDFTNHKVKLTIYENIYIMYKEDDQGYIDSQVTGWLVKENDNSELHMY